MTVSIRVDSRSLVPGTRRRQSECCSNMTARERIRSAFRLVAPIAQVSVLMILGVHSSVAAEIADLYQARTIVTGQGADNRGPGLARCFNDVLVKVSGDSSLMTNPQVTNLMKQPEPFVTAFRYHDRMEGIPLHDEQGTRQRPYDLTVDFDPVKIDGVLHSLGRKPWGASRPRLAVFLNIRFGDHSFALTDHSAQGIDERESLEAAAWRMGIPAVLPTPDTLSQAGLADAHFIASGHTALEAAARTIGGDIVLTGDLIWSQPSLSWHVKWRLLSSGNTYHWEALDVAKFDEAFRNGMRGSAQILSNHVASGQIMNIQR